MSLNCNVEYLSIGGNRHPAAADWDRNGSGILAFAADENIALWKPLVCKFGVLSLDPFKQRYHSYDISLILLTGPLLSRSVLNSFRSYRLRKCSSNFLN